MWHSIYCRIRQTVHKCQLFAGYGIVVASLAVEVRYTWHLFLQLFNESLTGESYLYIHMLHGCNAVGYWNKVRTWEFPYHWSMQPKEENNWNVMFFMFWQTLSLCIDDCHAKEIKISRLQEEINVLQGIVRLSLLESWFAIYCFPVVYINIWLFCFDLPDIWP